MTTEAEINVKWPQIMTARSHVQEAKNRLSPGSESNKPLIFIANTLTLEPKHSFQDLVSKTVSK